MYNRKTMVGNKKTAAKLIGAAMLSALVFAACGREEGADRAEGTQGASPSAGAAAGMPAGEGTDGGNVTSGAGADLSENDENADPEVSFEILRDARTDASGSEIVYAEYPVFSVDASGWEALASALASLNEEWRNQSTSFLESMEENAWRAGEASETLGQKTSVHITRCDRDIVSILVTRSVEEGGPHPNNYVDTFNLNARTGGLLELSDVVTVDDEFRAGVEAQLRENYPELEFDDALLEQGIADAFNQNSVSWSFRDNQISIGFPVGSFGFGAAEGSLGVILPQE